ncbi:hypothetical protein Scani_08750 [Streptomyces caniferus]|uniref:Uncharacterized protein n=1 Tax=Streptomyces caniferus TaxID=285557 RepID=A0A640S0X6_9ACTN|nr:hypothetical protein Scani_08750 [Streptomyces caniferus]
MPLGAFTEQPGTTLSNPWGAPDSPLSHDLGRAPPPLVPDGGITEAWSCAGDRTARPARVFEAPMMLYRGAVEGGTGRGRRQRTIEPIEGGRGGKAAFTDLPPSLIVTSCGLSGSSLA